MKGEVNRCSKRHLMSMLSLRDMTGFQEESSTASHGNLKFDKLACPIAITPDMPKCIYICHPKVKASSDCSDLYSSCVSGHMGSICVTTAKTHRQWVVANGLIFIFLSGHVMPP